MKIDCFADLALLGAKHRNAQVSDVMNLRDGSVFSHSLSGIELFRTLLAAASRQRQHRHRPSSRVVRFGDYNHKGRKRRLARSVDSIVLLSAAPLCVKS
jgi:hypothetical protein